MPKRKQKLPRRTRRQTSPKPSPDNEENGTNPYYPYNTKECQSTNAKEKAKIPMNNFKDTKEMEKTSNEMKEFKQRNMDHSKDMVKKDQESETNDCIENTIKHLSNPSENSNALKRNLKRPLDNVTLSVDVFKRPTASVNFRNESDDGNMPVILNVFTLCQVPASHSKQKATNILRENNFLVTPPCSPPLQKLEKVTTQIQPGNGFIKPAMESRMESNLCDVNNLIKHHRQNVNTAVPTPINRCVDERNYSVKNYVVQSDRKLGSNIIRFVPPENEPFHRFRDQERHSIFETKKCPNQGNCSESWKLAQRNHFLKNQRSNMKQELKNAAEQSELRHLSGSARSNVILSDKLKTAFRENKTGHFQHYELSPKTTLAAKSSCTTVQSVSGHDNPVNDSNVFLSPRDVKVLELKKKIQEQEEALKKLRTVH